MTERCVVYTRVSSKEQVSNLSLETQRERCIDFARSRGWLVDAVFVEEGESAKTTKRDQLQRLLDYCRKHRGHVQYVVVYAVDRFARNAEDHLVTRGHLAQYGARLRSVTEPLEDSPAGKLLETVFAALAQHNNDQRAERTTAGLKAAVARGHWPHFAPLGYRNARDQAGRPTLQPDPAWAPLIRQAFEWAAAGHSQREIAARLRALGARTRKGGRLPIQTGAYLLRNPVYAGTVRSRAFGLEAAAQFPPLVPLELFQGAQAALGRKDSAPTHSRQHPDFPLRHFVRCGECGKRPLTGYWAKGKLRPYAYYECPACRARVGRKRLEAAFVALLDELRPRPEYMALLKAEILDELKRAHADAARNGEALARRAGELRSRRERLTEAWVYARSIDRTTFEAMRAKLDAELAEVEGERPGALMSELDAGRNLDYGFRVAAQAGQLWRDAPPAQREALQGFVFPEGLTWTRAGFVRTPRTSMFFSGLNPVHRLECAGGVGSLTPFATPSSFRPLPSDRQSATCRAWRLPGSQREPRPDDVLIANETGGEPHQAPERANSLSLKQPPRARRGETRPCRAR